MNETINPVHSWRLQATTGLLPLPSFAVERRGIESHSKRLVNWTNFLMSRWARFAIESSKNLP